MRSQIGTVNCLLLWLEFECSHWLFFVAVVVEHLVPAGGTGFGGCGTFKEVRLLWQKEVTRNRSLENPPSSTSGFTVIGADSAIQGALSRAALPGLRPHDRSKP